jgi:quaternary ammonium compound-resistance protein SugE
MGAWTALVLAGLFEVVWAQGLKYSHGFTKLTPSVVTVLGAIVSFWLLSYAMKSLPVGTAYAVWVGIGTVGTAILAVAMLGEPVNAVRIGGIGLIVAGIVALKLA